LRWRFEGETVSYRVLALKWRPQRFSEVAGQAHISRTLTNALKTGRAAHAYLFTGPRGVGKTTMARVLAKALNCEQGVTPEPCGICAACVEITSGSALDVIEIDGASNRGIDDIRDLREGVRYAPARLRTKVYIIDEVHMLTTEAFNALLKTLEEPPPHVVFVLATTEVLKVPATILSRCQRFDFARLRSSEAVERMRFICDQEGIEIETDGLAVIASKGEGSMRDALTLLDQVVATGERPITAQVVRETLGMIGRDLFFDWTRAIREGDTPGALAALARVVDEGANLVELAEEFLVHLRNLLLVASDRTLLEQVEGTEEERELYAQEGALFEVADLLRFCRLLMEAIQQMRKSGYPRVHLEIVLAEMCALPRSVDLRRFADAVKNRVPDAPEADLAPARAPVRLPKADSASLPGGATSTELTPRRTRPTEPAVTSPAERASTAPERAPSAPAERPPSAPAERPSVEPSEHRRSARAKSSSRSANEPMREPPSRAASGLQSSSSISRGDGSPHENGMADVGDDPRGEERAAPLLETNDLPEDPWAGVLAEIARVKPSLQGFLSGSRASVLDGSILRVQIPGSPMYVEMLQAKDNRRILVELIHAQYGKPLGLRLETIPGEPRAEIQAPVPPKSAARGAIQRVVDLFDGDVLGPA
jgi:DNA polymerase-3 subunit gamma/tau